MSWQANLTLVDEGRQNLGLSRVVCEYEDVFSDELPRFPPHKDVDFVIELHLGTPPISMTFHRMAPVECMNSRSNYRICWTRVLLDRELHHEALRFYLLRRRTRLFNCALIIDS